MLPSPAAIRLGICNFSERAQEARVLTPTSPKDSLSGIAPMPKESRTIKNTRFIETSILDKVGFGDSPVVGRGLDPAGWFALLLR